MALGGLHVLGIGTAGLTSTCRIFNSGSQMNVPAGQGGINLDKVIAHYEKQTYAENERKLKAMREGTLEAERSNAPAYRVTSEK